MTGNNLWSANDGNGWMAYDSLQIIVEHRFGDLNLESSYVKSKNLTDNAYIQIFGEYGNVTLQDPNNKADGKTLANSDYPNMLNFTMSYLLPVGRGKKFLGSTSPWLNKIVSGWTIAGVGQYRSGNLFEITSPTNNLNTYMGWDITKANYTGAAIKTNIATNTLNPDDPTKLWFNASTTTPPSPPPTRSALPAALRSLRLRWELRGMHPFTTRSSATPGSGRRTSRSTS